MIFYKVLFNSEDEDSYDVHVGNIYPLYKKGYFYRGKPAVKLLVNSDELLLFNEDELKLIEEDVVCILRSEYESLLNK